MRPRDIPAISVIIPAHNMSRFIQDAVESVLRQELVPTEVVVVDDGSTDDTRTALDPYRKHINYVYQEQQGVSAARNAGLELAHGEWVAFLDADDVFLPSKLRAQIAALTRGRDVDIVHSGWITVDEVGDELKTHEPWKHAPRLTLREWLLWKPVFLGAMLIRRKAILRSGGFFANLAQAEDVDLILRLSLAGHRMIWLKQPTIYKRVHPGNLTGQEPQQAEALSTVIGRFFERSDLPKSIRRIEPEVRLYTGVWNAWRLFQYGFQQQAVHYLSDAVRQLDWPIGKTAIQVLHEFQRQSDRSGPGAPAKLSGGHDILPALGIDERQRRNARTAVEWWTRVWQPLTNHDRESVRNALQEFDGENVDSTTELIRYCLEVSSQQITLSDLNGLWTDFTQTRQALAPHKSYLVSIHLTFAARLIADHRWRTAAAALISAVLHTTTVPALRAWVRTASTHLARRLHRSRRPV